ncbi:MAG: hypothetical protein JWR80_8533 [Bradyrhizobium sp.]|nr:hypothetical protein [Bradyrhizobium sp.]
MSEPAKHGHAEDRRAVYQQDCDFMRYRDGRKWSRFQTISAIEGAALYAAFQVHGLGLGGASLILIVATTFIVLLCLQAITDDRALAAHLRRVREFEHRIGARFDLPNLRPFLGIKTSRVVMAVTLMFNLGVLVFRFRYWVGG